MPSLLSLLQLCPPTRTGILQISGLRGLEAAALLSHGKSQGQNVYCEPAAYAQGDPFATAVLCFAFAERSAMVSSFDSLLG